MQGLQSKLIKALAFIHKKSQITDSEFEEYYETHHAPLAQSLLNFEYYERNYINSNLCPFYPSLGSISIFKYESEKSLEIVGEQMASNTGDTLRKDELNFMHVEENFHVLTNSSEISTKTYSKKIFLIARDKNGLKFLDKFSCIQKISDNLIADDKKMVAIPEYGINADATINDIELIIDEFPQIILAKTIS
jgi:uncharacterized protein (TIGR02118 family)